MLLLLLLPPLSHAGSHLVAADADAPLGGRALASAAELARVAALLSRAGRIGEGEARPFAAAAACFMFDAAVESACQSCIPPLE